MEKILNNFDFLLIQNSPPFFARILFLLPYPIPFIRLLRSLIQNVRQYHFHDVAKYGKISQKESKKILSSLGQNGYHMRVI